VIFRPLGERPIFENVRKMGLSFDGTRFRPYLVFNTPPTSEAKEKIELACKNYT
jgi:hypothetical protein